MHLVSVLLREANALLEVNQYTPRTCNAQGHSTSMKGRALQSEAAKFDYGVMDGYRKWGGICQKGDTIPQSPINIPAKTASAALKAPTGVHPPPRCSFHLTLQILPKLALVMVSHASANFVGRIRSRPGKGRFIAALQESHEGALLQACKPRCCLSLISDLISLPSFT